MLEEAYEDIIFCECHKRLRKTYYRKVTFTLVRPSRSMFLVGLTGGIATGKSTVSKMFSELGVPVIDADIIARRVEPGKKAWKRIRAAFGHEIFFENGQLNRAALADIIFADATKRQQLNRIIHPEIFKEMCWEIVGNFVKGYRFVILDLPLLFESGMWGKYLKSIIVVTCDDELQMERLIQRNQLTKVEAVARVNAQMSLSDKRSKAQYIIENSGTLLETKQQVAEVHRELCSNLAYLKVRILFLSVLAIGVGGVSYLVTKYIL